MDRARRMKLYTSQTIFAHISWEDEEINLHLKETHKVPLGSAVVI